MSTGQLEVLREAYGDQFVGYVLNVEPYVLIDEAWSPTDTQLEFIEILQLPANQVLSQPSTLRGIVAGNVLRLTVVDEGTEVGLVTQIRKACGGPVPSIDSDDGLEKTILKLVRDYFPLLLMRIEDQAIGHYPFVAPLLGTSEQTLLSRILRDPDLGLLFPGVSENSPMPQSDVKFSSGFGTTLQLQSVPSALVTYALVMAGVFGVTRVEDSLRFGREALACARRLAKSKSSKVPVIVGLANVSLGDDVDSVEVGHGTIVRPSDVVSARYEPGTSKSASAVLVAEMDEDILQIADGSVDRGSAYDDWASFRRKLNSRRTETVHTIDMARYAVLLASSEDEWLAPAITFSASVNPISVSWATEVPHVQPSIGAGGEYIDRVLADRIQEWSGLIRARHSESLNIGVRRLLSAVTARSDPVDSFIDAVICWENMFGEGGETTLKVCGSIARVLSSDEQARATYYNDLKEIYQKRSRVVHGSSELLDLEKARDLRDQAVSVAIKIMRRAYELDGFLDADVSRWKYAFFELP